jgi:hypothetical protein
MLIPLAHAADSLIRTTSLSAAAFVTCFFTALWQRPPLPNVTESIVDTLLAPKGPKAGPKAKWWSDLCAMVDTRRAQRILIRCEAECNSQYPMLPDTDYDRKARLEAADRLMLPVDDTESDEEDQPDQLNLIPADEIVKACKNGLLHLALPQTIELRQPVRPPGWFDMSAIAAAIQQSVEQAPLPPLPLLPNLTFLHEVDKQRRQDPNSAVHHLIRFKFPPAVVPHVLETGFAPPVAPSADVPMHV